MKTTNRTPAECRKATLLKEIGLKPENLPTKDEASNEIYAAKAVLSRRKSVQ
jgi:hypothetical protein